MTTPSRKKNIPFAARPALVTPPQRFVGTVLADGQNANVTAVACQDQGEALVLILCGPRTTVAAIAAQMHRAKSPKQVSFFPRPNESWDGPDRLQRAVALGSSWITAQVGPTVYQNIAILANAANLAYCRLNPVAFPGNEESVSRTMYGPFQGNPKRLVPPSRFVLATEGASHPDWLAFAGMMRTLWLPFPLSLAPALWEAGRHEPLCPHDDEQCRLTGEHTLIEPVVHTLGIEAWQIIPTRQWENVLKRVTCQHASLTS